MPVKNLFVDFQYYVNYVKKYILYIIGRKCTMSLILLQPVILNRLMLVNTEFIMLLKLKIP